MNVVINGTAKQMFASTASYADVVEAAGQNPEQILTVTYSVKGGVNGNLLPGREVVLVEGIRFNVADTSNA